MDCGLIVRPGGAAIMSHLRVTIVGSAQGRFRGDAVGSLREDGISGVAFTMSSTMLQAPQSGLPHREAATISNPDQALGRSFATNFPSSDHQ